MTVPTSAPACSSSGGSTSAETLIKAAHLVLDNYGIIMSPSKVTRLVRQYQHRVAQNGFSFFAFLANAVQLSAEQQRAALRNPDVVLAISYADPVGELATDRVLRQRGY
jgi:hypothetical protein